MINFLIVSISIFSLILLLSDYLIKEYSRNKYKYSEILALLNFFLDESYAMTYESDLITYVSNGVKDIPKEEKETIERNFVKQTITIMGPKNRKLFLDFFGNDENAFVFYIIRFIRKKFNNDYLSKLLRQEEEKK